jgi:hypothetical protein
MLKITTTLPATAISNRWMQSKIMRETWIGASGSTCYNPVRCYSAFAHTPTSPTSLNSRCSALGPETEAPHNGQAAAPIHRAHPPFKRAPRRLRQYWPRSDTYAHRLLAPPSAHTTYRHRTRSGVRNYWHQGGAVLAVSLPTTPSERTRENGPLQPEHAMWFPLIFAQSRTVLQRNVSNGH